MFTAPAVAGGKLIVLSCAGSVYALDGGKEVWTYDTAEDGPRVEFHGAAAVVGKRVIAPSDGDPQAHLYAFDADSGEVQWRVPFPGGVPTDPLIVDGSVIVASATGRLARIAIDSGKTQWTVTPAGELAPVPRLPSPATDGKRVYFATNDGKLFAIDAPSGETAWKKELGPRVTTSLALHGKTLYAGLADGHLYAIDAATGDVVRKTSVQGLAAGSIVVAPPVLLTLVKTKLLALDLATGEIRWQRTSTREWSTMTPLLLGDTVIAGNEEKELCALALADGAPRWCEAVPQIPRGLGAANGTLYVGTLNGKVLAYRLP